MTTPIFDNLHAEFLDAGRFTLEGGDDVLVVDVEIPAQPGRHHEAFTSPVVPDQASPSDAPESDLGDWHGPIPDPRG